MKKTLLLCILDGVGLREEKQGNAFKQANTPFIDSLFNKYPNCKLDASGKAVGLPENTMGNSEVGHMNIGAGKIVYQPSQFINEEIINGNYYKNENLVNFIRECKNNNRSLHIIGMISDAGVHSLLNHLYGILDITKKENLDKVYIHGISDGRDTPPTSAIDYFRKLDETIKEKKIASLVTIIGRYYAMDRDNRWDRVKKAYDALIYRTGNKFDNYETAIKDSYDKGINDEFIEPIILDENVRIEENDYIIDFNFRPDRLRELLSSLTNPDFNQFETTKYKNKMLTLMPVSNEVICINAYKNQEVNTPLGVVLSNNNKTQLRIAETEKYAHVTYFFDGGVERDLKGASRILIPSPKVATYDLSPKMSAEEITTNLLSELDKNIHDVVILNFANGDMLGHTGKMKETIESLEFLDTCVEKIYNKIKEIDGTLLITADHGNCEYMLNDNNEPVTSHTTNKVPFIICKENYNLHDGKLSDISPTILKLLEIEVPEEMTGVSLID